jgi:predicted ribosomally synthesized peptide with SipW-like signal peptide
MAAPELTRRKILAGICGIGATGAVSGGGTYAFLTRRVDTGGQIRSGTVSINVDCSLCSVVDNTVSFAVDGIDRGESGRETLEITVGTNPARLWLRTDCPPVPDRLGDVLLVRLSRDGETLASGSLSSVRRALRTGIRLDADCTAPGEPLELHLDWELPGETADSVAGSGTALSFDLAAEQCRHTPDDGFDAVDVLNPFATTSPCDEQSFENNTITAEACHPCQDDRIASATFEYDSPTGLVELIRAGNGAGSGSGNRDVLTSQSLDAGDQFVATFHDPPEIRGGPDIEFVVDGQRVDTFHISCSEPFGPGLVITDGTYTLTVLSAVDAGGNTLCEVSLQ